MNKSLLALVSLFGVVISIAQPQASGSFTATGNMRFARGVGHTATLLTNGKVLIAGGRGDGPGSTSNAELFDPSTGFFEVTGSMTTSRLFHTATLLADGRVLIVGGNGYRASGGINSLTATAELYDPSTGSFTPAGAVSSLDGLAWHATTVLGNGRILIAGTVAVLYDPASGTFANAGPYSDRNPSWVRTATLLRDGRVLLIGGAGYRVGFAEIYNPTTDSFSPTGGENADFGWDAIAATLLPDGKVLIVGSQNSGDNQIPVFPAEVELYDPSTGLFTRIGQTQEGYYDSNAMLLPDGRVLIIGGQWTGSGGDSSVELYDPATGKLALAGKNIFPRSSATATLLPDATFLIAGGWEFGGFPYFTAEIYHPPAPTYNVAGGSARLANVSARAIASNGAGSLIVGFVLQGAGAKSVLLRGVGPTLARPPFSIPGAATGLRLRLNNGVGVQLDSNAGWNASAALTQATQQAGAFSLIAGSADAALVASLGADAYTAEISALSGSGVALVEVYDLGGSGAATSRLSNLSVRASVGQGENILVAGFVVGGTEKETVLVRAIGPTLAKPPFNVQGALAGPVLNIFDAGGDLVASNMTWGGTAALTYAFVRAGAFPLPTNSNDAACLVTLSPGAYTVQVSGVNQQTGTALIEVYDLQ